MRTLHSVSIASVLALGLTVAAFPAAAQSSTSGSTATQGSSSTTGALPDNSLAGQRQGAIGGGSVSQGGSGSAEGSADKPKQGSGQ